MRKKVVFVCAVLFWSLLILQYVALNHVFLPKSNVSESSTIGLEAKPVKQNIIFTEEDVIIMFEDHYEVYPRVKPSI
ncbi:MAG: hypothetical protein H6607_11360 [Flavobacteriales bacterium]|nr:hypothetical protein [Flavobacteriales bacterium]